MSDTLRLLESARTGDAGALDSLFARHRGRLLAFVAARLDGRTAELVSPEDVVQEAYLEASRQVGSFEPEGPAAFYRWLVGIARYKLSEAYRARRAKKRASVAALSHEPAADQSSASGRAMRDETAARIAAALAEIPGGQAAAVRLRYLEGLSVAECAERLHRTEAAVKSLVSRGLGALAGKLPRTS